MTQMANSSRLPQTRLLGLDLARFVAFVGMVIVNFKVVMVSEPVLASGLSLFTDALEGRAAATFVVLAGIGLGLAASFGGAQNSVSTTVKRASFLLIIGLLNTLIFSADILHYYAFYFLFGAFLLPLSNRLLVATIVVINIVFVTLLFSLDFDLGWNWQTLDYAEFWTFSGFTRNLFFNGWHPVFPWLSFLLVGIIFSRLELSKRTMQMKMIWYGLGGLISAEMISRGLIAAIGQGDEELIAILGTGPVPPMPLYILAGISAAMIVIGLCLRFANSLEKTRVLKYLLPAGRQTLTLYFAHIFVGMGSLEALGMLGGQTLETAVLAAMGFCVAAGIYAYFWAKAFKRGPVEAVMRWVAG